MAGGYSDRAHVDEAKRMQPRCAGESRVVTIIPKLYVDGAGFQSRNSAPARGSEA